MASSARMNEPVKTIRALAACPWVPTLLLLWPSRCASVEQLPTGFPTCRGAFAFCTASHLNSDSLSSDELEWLGRFDVILTNGYELPSKRVREFLQDRGSKLFMYFWTNGFVAGELDMLLPDVPWRNQVLAHADEWLLSPEVLDGPPGTPPSFYFDLANQDLTEFLCRHLTAHRIKAGYDGVFFDYAGAYALPTSVMALWRERHSDLPYDRAVGGLFKRLRTLDPSVLVFTNQAYRSAEPVLPEVDYDLAESYGTSFAWGPTAEAGGEQVSETFFRPWAGVSGLAELYGALEERVRATPPRRALLYLDYMRPRYRRFGGQVAKVLDREAVYYSYCAAALFGRKAFCSGWYAGLEYRGPLYFASLGRPLGERPRVHQGVVTREYERGLVALSTSARPTRIRYELQAPTARLYDLYSGAEMPVCGNVVTVQLVPARSRASGTVNPVGRVYLKLPAPAG